MFVDPCEHLHSVHELVHVNFMVHIIFTNQLKGREDKRNVNKNNTGRKYLPFGWSFSSSVLFVCGVLGLQHGFSH